MRRALSLLLFPLLLVLGLGGCGDDESSSPLDDVEVTGDDGEQPTLEFEQPFSVEETTRSILSDGDGEAVTDGSTAIFHFLFVNGRDGSEFGSSYDLEPAEVVIDDQLMAGVQTVLDGLKAGSRVVAAIAPADGFGPQGGDPDNGLEADDTLLLVIDLIDVRTPLARAEGETVDPPEGLPTVELDEDGAPTISLPEDKTVPAETVAQVLIEGEGDVVESGQSITVHYSGVLWDTGETFDSSWDGSPATFPIGTGGVIPGWDKGLVGQTVGSQVLLVIPPGDAYAERGSGPVPPDAALVFVVDILDARD